MNAVLCGVANVFVCMVCVLVCVCLEMNMWVFVDCCMVLSGVCGFAALCLCVVCLNVFVCVFVCGLLCDVAGYGVCVVVCVLCLCVCVV